MGKILRSVNETFTDVKGLRQQVGKEGGMKEEGGTEGVIEGCICVYLFIAREFS